MYSSYVIHRNEWKFLSIKFYFLFTCIEIYKVLSFLHFFSISFQEVLVNWLCNSFLEGANQVIFNRGDFFLHFLINLFAQFCCLSQNEHLLLIGGHQKFFSFLFSEGGIFPKFVLLFDDVFVPKDRVHFNVRLKCSGHEVKEGVNCNCCLSVGNHWLLEDLVKILLLFQRA